MQARNRRVFMLHAITSAAALGVTATAAAQAADPNPGQTPSDVPVKETDAYPKSMGYRIDTATVDKAKFPRHEVSQKCSECQLWSGKAGDQLGTCSFFKRPVPPGGWCRNFKPKKAAT
jgi:High potential iron-sulfur protein